jgi:hypothetical protein
MSISTKNRSLPFYYLNKLAHKKKDTVDSVFFSGGMWLTFIIVERRANDN